MGKFTKNDALSLTLQFTLAAAAALGVYYLAGFSLASALVLGAGIIGMNCLMLFVGYFFSDKLALAHFKGKITDVQNPDPDPQLQALREDIAELLTDEDADNIPMPKRIIVIEDDMMNAFATGRNPKNAVVAVTRGLLNTLDRKEIKAVLAHELSHVKNGDVLRMTVTATLATVLSVVGNNLYKMKMDSIRSNNKNAGSVILLTLAAIIVFHVAMFATKAAMMMISRQRELDADHDGGDICNDPESLASALAKISTKGRVISEPHEKEELQAMTHFFIADPFSAKNNFNQVQNQGFFGSLISWYASAVSTHPAPEIRVKRLLEKARRTEISHEQAKAFIAKIDGLDGLAEEAEMPASIRRLSPARDIWSAPAAPEAQP